MPLGRVRLSAGWYMLPRGLVCGVGVGAKPARGSTLYCRGRARPMCGVGGGRGLPKGWMRLPLGRDGVPAGWYLLPRGWVWGLWVVAKPARGRTQYCRG